MKELIIKDLQNIANQLERTPLKLFSSTFLRVTENPPNVYIT